MYRIIIAAILVLTVCLSSGCGLSTRAVVADTRPTAAQAQAQADSGKSIADLSAQLAAARQKQADDAAAYAQIAHDLAAAKLARDELIMDILAGVAVFLAVAIEALSLCETKLAWLLKPAAYVIAGIAVTAVCFRVALPYLGLAEGLVFFLAVAVTGYSLRNTALAKRAEAEGKALIGEAEAEAKALLTKAHILKQSAAPVPPPVGTVIPPA